MEAEAGTEAPESGQRHSYKKKGEELWMYAWCTGVAIRLLSSACEPRAQSTLVTRPQT
jgi:hypothetical protein